MDVLQSISNSYPGYIKRYTVVGNVHKQSNLLIGSICKRQTVYEYVRHTMASGCVCVCVCVCVWGGGGGGGYFTNVIHNIHI